MVWFRCLLGPSSISVSAVVERFSWASVVKTGALVAVGTIGGGSIAQAWQPGTLQPLTKTPAATRDASPAAPRTPPSSGVEASGSDGATVEVDASAILDAVRTYVGQLSDDQKTQGVLKYDDPARLDWHFIPKPTRKGVAVRDMTREQAASARAVLAACLSAAGQEAAKDIMALDNVLKIMEEGRPSGNERDGEKYYLTLFGEAKPQGSLGISWEGHHLSLNFVVRDGKLVSSTPAFFGSNPAEFQSDVGTAVSERFRKGYAVLADEDQRAFVFLASLDSDQRVDAVTASKAPDELRGAGDAQPTIEPIRGLAASKMTPEQVTALKELIGVYAGKMPLDEARRRVMAIEAAGFDQVHFAWLGSDKPGQPHAYRIEGPTFTIEFVNVQADAEGNPANHIHSVWRDRRGDFDRPLSK